MQISPFCVNLFTKILISSGRTIVNYHKAHNSWHRHPYLFLRYLPIFTHCRTRKDQIKMINPTPNAKSQAQIRFQYSVHSITPAVSPAQKCKYNTARPGVFVFSKDTPLKVFDVSRTPIENLNGGFCFSQRS